MRYCVPETRVLNLMEKRMTRRANATKGKKNNRSPSNTVHHGQATAVNATLRAGGGGGGSRGCGRNCGGAGRRRRCNCRLPFRPCCCCCWCWLATTTGTDDVLPPRPPPNQYASLSCAVIDPGGVAIIGSKRKTSTL